MEALACGEVSANAASSLLHRTNNNEKKKKKKLSFKFENREQLRPLVDENTRIIYLLLALKFVILSF